MEPNFYVTLTRDEEGDTALRRHETMAVPTLKELQYEVGGLIEPAFTVDSPFRPGYSITGYVNEEGWMLDLPSFIRVHGQPMAGNMIVMGLHDATGESALLTDEEADWFSLCVRRSFGAYNIVV